MTTIEKIRSSIMKVMQAGDEPEPEDLSKSADQVLADAVANYLKTSPAASEPTATKTSKRIKEKGIALTAAVQGGPANLRPVSLLMKADVSTLTPEQRAALERLGYAINGTARAE